jgi:predicted nucleotidyltransferase
MKSGFFDYVSRRESALINKAPNLSGQKRAVIELLVEKLSNVAGMAAIVLGGSYASGTQHANSDIDLGLYYYEARPFSIDEIQAIANEMSVDGIATVTDFYGWGAWVNGGAWIHTPVGKIDFLYRNVDQVQKTIAEAQQGISHHDYDQQPTYGFYSLIYLAETDICIPLYDPESVIAKLKRSVEVYPPLLKKKVIADSLWAAEFTLLHARGFAGQGDIYNTVGCLTRAASNITQALFALNEQYFIRDKKVLETVAQFSHLPPGYIQQINHILACPGNTAAELTKTVMDLEQAWQSVVSLPGVQYEPKFRM